LRKGKKDTLGLSVKKEAESKEGEKGKGRYIMNACKQSQNIDFFSAKLGL
jgi:hypothetical protein